MPVCEIGLHRSTLLIMHKCLVRLTAELLSDVIVSIRISESCVVQSNRMTILLQQVFAEVYAYRLLPQLSLCSPVSTLLETPTLIRVAVRKPVYCCIAEYAQFHNRYRKAGFDTTERSCPRVQTDPRPHLLHCL